MKKFLITTLFVVILSFLTLAQTRSSYLYEFLGKSKGEITKIWGSPEQVTVDKSGYVVWYYTYSGAVRTFYFYGSYVELCGSVIVVDSYDYAAQVADALAEKFTEQGFYVYEARSDVTILSNGRVFIDVQFGKYSYNQYSISLLTYR